MLLTIDVGNTNITMGVFDGEDLLGSFRFTTKINRTSDEFGIVIREILRSNNLDYSKIEDVIIASVVPNVMHSLTSSIIKYFDIQPIIVEAGIKTGIRIATENPKQIGADRIVDAAGAYELYGGPVLVLDFGTATTYDLVDEKGAFVSGVTAPGIRISARALWEDAAKLPEIEINHRRPHGGNGASYLPIHCDAAVGNPELNLIFTNRYDFPIRIVGTSNDDGALLMRIYRYHGDEAEIARAD